MKLTMHTPPQTVKEAAAYLKYIVENWKGFQKRHRNAVKAIKILLKEVQ